MAAGLGRGPASARQLREVLVQRIAQGQYSIGEQLPGTRDLAVEMGANRNTVAKVYGELAREGLLKIVAGRGAFVVGRIDPAAGQEPSTQVAQLMEDAVSRARLFGLSRDDVLRLVADRITATYDEEALRLVFVESNLDDAQLGASELTTQLGMLVESLLLTDVPTDGALPFDVAATSLFHIEEVDRLLASRGVEVVTVNTVPEPSALEALARLPSRTRIGIVAANQIAVERLSLLVQTYCHAQVRWLITPSDAALDVLVRWSEVLVCGPSCAAQAHSRAEGQAVIVLVFHVDPQSVQRVRSDILVRARSRQGDRA